jgi:hypothetical protein
MNANTDPIRSQVIGKTNIWSMFAVAGLLIAVASMAVNNVISNANSPASNVANAKIVRFVSNSQIVIIHETIQAIARTIVINPMLPSPVDVIELHTALAPHPILEQSTIVFTFNSSFH